MTVKFHCSDRGTCNVFKRPTLLRSRYPSATASVLSSISILFSTEWDHKNPNNDDLRRTLLVIQLASHRVTWKYESNSALESNLPMVIPTLVNAISSNLLTISAERDSGTERKENLTGFTSSQIETISETYILFFESQCSRI